MAERLKDLQLAVRTGVGGHGVVATLRGGKPGGTVAFRAEMDAVRDAALDPAEYRSRVSGVRHICGHDVHTTVALAIAEAMASIRAEIPGTVVFIFQPAEETAAGARAMIDDGAISDPTPSAIFSLHVAPLEVGKIGSTEGLLLPPTTMAEIVFTGEGDLEALATSAASLAQAITEIGPAANPAGVASIEQIPLSNDFRVVQPFRSAAGPEENQWTLQLMIRGSSAERFDQVRQMLAGKLDTLLGVQPSGETERSYAIEYLEEATSGVFNNPTLVRATDASLRAILGESAVVPMAGAVPFFSEDFGHFQRIAPGAMYWLGASNSDKGFRAMPHAPDFRVDEDAIFVGAKAMSGVLLRHLLASANSKANPEATD